MFVWKTIYDRAYYYWKYRVTKLTHEKCMKSTSHYFSIEPKMDFVKMFIRSKVLKCCWRVWIKTFRIDTKKSLKTNRENLCPHKKLYADVYFVIAWTWKQPICPSIGEWINELWQIQTVEYSLGMKRNQLSGHEKT